MSNVLMKGIDVSAYQTNVDYNKVKNAGYDFVIIRAGWGRDSGQKDSEFEKHYENATKAGLHVGAYHYSYALTDNNCTMSPKEQGIAEANNFYSYIKNKKYDMPVFYDVEEPKALDHSKQELDELVTAFCTQMEQYGYWCGIYGGQYLFESKLNQSTVTRYSTWYAQYLLEPLYKGPIGIWQFGVAGADLGNNPTGVKSVPGVNGQCDMDYCYVDYPTQIKAKGLNGYSNSNPDQPKVTPIEEFTPRLTIPESGNKYYNTPSVGGYAVGAILGNPLQNGLNILSNCVGFAAARFNEIINKDKWIFLTYPPNAEDFISKAKSEGLEILNKPEIGSIIVWAKGQVGNSSDGAGHVAVVEAVNEDGSIVTSESGYGCSPTFWTSKRYNSDDNWGAGNTYRFLGFIKNPAIDSNTKVKETNTDNDTKPTTKNPYKEPTVLIKEGSEGEGVKWLQWYLTEYGYFNDPISGKFDIITYGALLAYQSKNGLTVDGICGPSTRNSLKSKEK